MATLARHLGKVVHTNFLPKTELERANKTNLREQLLEWKEKLPLNMCSPTSDAIGATSYANTLHLAYNDLLILLYRTAYTRGTAEADEADGQIAFRAACTNTRITEDMLLQDVVQHGQVHLITVLFNSLCIHTVSIRREFTSGIGEWTKTLGRACQCHALGHRHFWRPG